MCDARRPRRLQAEGQAGTLTKRPAGSGGRPAAGGPVARKAAASRRPTSGGRPGGGGGGAGILRFYSDDAPGLKMCARHAPLPTHLPPQSLRSWCQLRMRLPAAPGPRQAPVRPLTSVTPAPATPCAVDPPPSWCSACSSSPSSCCCTSGASSARAEPTRRSDLAATPAAMRREDAVRVHGPLVSGALRWHRHARLHFPVLATSARTLVSLRVLWLPPST